MRTLGIPDSGRIFADIVSPEVSPGEGDRYGVIHAWRTEPDSYDLSPFSQSYLCLRGVAQDGTRTIQIQVPEGALQGFRERVAAMYVGALLFLGRTK